ncbi:response regulator [Breoghania sp. L-A4]|uniref:response regulator n=1 Tax=Breoghania sp. L-A4 TaxID=2304600 RepID=UPI0013C34E0A|nr:response regulator [Breoghania sp. L-A4]
MDKRLLVVDDEIEFGEIIERIATKLGFDVCKTTRPSEFRKMYDQFDPTHIFMDVIMPEMDGVELVQWLSQRGCKAKVVIMSGSSASYINSTRAIAADTDLNIVATLAKPCKVAAIRSVLSD